MLSPSRCPLDNPYEIFPLIYASLFIPIGDGRNHLSDRTEMPTWLQRTTWRLSLQNTKPNCSQDTDACVAAKSYHRCEIEQREFSWGSYSLQATPVVQCAFEPFLPGGDAPPIFPSSRLIEYRQFQAKEKSASEPDPYLPRMKII